MPKPSSNELADVLPPASARGRTGTAPRPGSRMPIDEEPADRVAVDQPADDRAHRADDEDDQRRRQEDRAARPARERVDDVRIDRGDREDAEAEPEELDDDAGARGRTSRRRSAGVQPAACEEGCAARRRATIASRRVAQDVVGGVDDAGAAVHQPPVGERPPGEVDRTAAGAGDDRDGRHEVGEVLVHDDEGRRPATPSTALAAPAEQRCAAARSGCRTVATRRRRRPRGD